MRSFSLIDEPWIPVRDLKGERLEVGIKDALLRADEFAAIEHPSPLVVASIYRLLLAVLYRALRGPADLSSAKEIVRQGFSPAKIQEYLDVWRMRFDLYDERQPFYQNPLFEPRSWRTWTALAAEHNADNAKVLFDHAIVERPGAISAGAAARWLLAAQTFSVSAGKSEIAHTGTAPSASALLVIPVGCNLAQTLCYCLVPQNAEITEIDRPVWERDPESIEVLLQATARLPSGYADLYTWPIRTIRLRPEDDGTVSYLGFASGVGVGETAMCDPMAAFKLDDKRGKLPIQLRDRGTWRDFDSLLPDHGQLAPRVIEFVSQLVRSRVLPAPNSFLTIGQANNKAKIRFWRIQRFRLAPELFSSPSARLDIRKTLEWAEKGASVIRRAYSTYVRFLLSHGSRDPDQEEISKAVRASDCVCAYWVALEADFTRLLVDYTETAARDILRRKWCEQIRDALTNAWNLVRQTSDTRDVWTLRAFSKADKVICKHVALLNEEIVQYEEAK